MTHLLISHALTFALNTARMAVWLALLLSATFVISMRLQAPDRASLFRLVINYGYALAIFTLAYRLRRRFRPQPLLDGLAAISYPLYLLHPLLGYSLLKILLMSAGMAFAPALALTAAAVTLTAWLVHRTIERPGIRLGHILGARYPLSFAASSRRST